MITQRQLAALGYAVARARIYLKPEHHIERAAIDEAEAALQVLSARINPPPKVLLK